MITKLTQAILFPLSLLLATCAATSLRAQSSFTWTGSSSGNWSDNANWTQGADGPGGSSSRPQTYLNFPSGPSQLLTTNDYTAYSSAFQVYFNSGASSYTLYGDWLKFYDYGGIAARIQNDSSNPQTIEFPFGVGTSAGIDINANSGDLNINCGGNGIFLDGPSQLRINGGSGRTVAFNTAITDGTPAGGTFSLNGPVTAHLSRCEQLHRRHVR